MSGNPNEAWYGKRSHHNYKSFKHYLLYEGVPIFGRASFCYESSYGEVTTRVVDLIRYIPDGVGTMILGLCYLRNDYRVFNIRPIWGLRDRLTGAAQDEVLDWLHTLRGAEHISERPTDAELANWVKPPVMPTLEQGSRWLNLLGAELLEKCGKDYVFKVSVDSGSSRVWLALESPKLRGEGMANRAMVQFWPEEIRRSVDSNGVEVRRQTRLRIKPWRVDISRKGYKGRTFEFFSEARQYLVDVIN